MTRRLFGAAGKMRKTSTQNYAAQFKKRGCGRGVSLMMGELRVDTLPELASTVIAEEGRHLLHEKPPAKAGKGKRSVKKNPILPLKAPKTRKKDPGEKTITLSGEKKKKVQ